MPDIHETAYPRLKSSFSDKELYEFYAPSGPMTPILTQMGQLHTQCKF